MHPLRAIIPPTGTEWYIFVTEPLRFVCMRGKKVLCVQSFFFFIVNVWEKAFGWDLLENVGLNPPIKMFNILLFLPLILFFCLSLPVINLSAKKLKSFSQILIDLFKLILPLIWHYHFIFAEIKVCIVFNILNKTIKLPQHKVHNHKPTSQY